MSDIKESEEKMKKSIESLRSELATIRAGRANPHILDGVTVDYYGTPTPLNQAANISVPEARMLQIQPWDASLLKEIEKAIQIADIGLTPTNDGKTIRLIFPELTEDRRKELAKEVKKQGRMPKWQSVISEEMPMMRQKSKIRTEIFPTMNLRISKLTFSR